MPQSVIVALTFFFLKKEINIVVSDYDINLKKFTMLQLVNETLLTLVWILFPFQNYFSN